MNVYVWYMTNMCLYDTVFLCENILVIYKIQKLDQQYQIWTRYVFVVYFVLVIDPREQKRENIEADRAAERHTGHLLIILRI